MNLFDDLSKTFSNNNVGATVNALKKNTSEELNFKDIAKKIGFKRKITDVIPTIGNEQPTQPAKKIKKS